MTLTLLNIDKYDQMFVSLIFNNIMKISKYARNQLTTDGYQASILLLDLPTTTSLKLFSKIHHQLWSSVKTQCFRWSLFCSIKKTKKNIVRCLIYNLTNINYKFDTEKLPFLILDSLQILHSSKISSKTILKPLSWACSKAFEKITLHL